MNLKDVILDLWQKLSIMTVLKLGRIITVHACFMVNIEPDSIDVLCTSIKLLTPQYLWEASCTTTD
jgi:hypothetical protein